MKIFVTGATGFMGQSLCRALRTRGDTVTAIGSRDCDLRHTGSLHTFPDGTYDRIFHLAAWTQAGDFCLKHPGEQWIINQQINTQVLAWWQERQPQAKLVSIGTSCAYDPALPLAEENYLKGDPIPSLFAYAMTKRMLYCGQMALRQQFGLKSLTVVPSTLYGAGYPDDGRQPHFVFDLVRKILRGKHQGDAVTLWGDGSQRRELIHVSDFISLLLTLDRDLGEGLVNLGAGTDHSIREFAEMISRIAGFDPSRIAYDVSRHVGAKSKLLDVALLNRLAPGRRLIPLEEGLREVIAETESRLVRR